MKKGLSCLKGAKMTGKGLNRIVLSFLLLSFFFIYQNSYSACTPSSAQLCAAVDDDADIYINGTFIDSFPYCDVGWVCSVKCISLSGAQLSLLQQTGNVIAVELLNTDASEMWASWSLDITCSDGTHSYVSSSDITDISMYYDNSPCPADPAPNDGGGLPWYDPLYDDSTSGVSWTAPLVETGYKWGKRLYDPQTGNLLPALSYAVDSSTGVLDCKQIFFRQGFDLTIDPTPVPPNFTITKSANRTEEITGPGLITFTINICNTGSGTQGEQVRVFDTWTSSQWQYQGPWGPWYDETFGNVSRTNADQHVDVSYLFENGFPGGQCYTFVYWVQTWNPVTNCLTWYNTAYAQYPVGTPVASAQVELQNLCPSSTATRTVTPTRTATPTRTPTRTITLTRTPTPTRTITPPAGSSPTFTPTATRTITPTATPTPQPTMAITKTANVSTAVFGSMVTYTLAYRNTGLAVANPVCIYDTVPSVITYVGSSVAPTTGPPYLSWCFGPVAAGASGTITWWGTISAYPFSPFYEHRESFAAGRNPCVARQFEAYIERRVLPGYIFLN